MSIIPLSSIPHALAEENFMSVLPQNHSPHPHSLDTYE